MQRADVVAAAELGHALDADHLVARRHGVAPRRRAAREPARSRSGRCAVPGAAREQHAADPPARPRRGRSRAAAGSAASSPRARAAIHVVIEGRLAEAQRGIASAAPAARRWCRGRSATGTKTARGPPPARPGAPDLVGGDARHVAGNREERGARPGDAARPARWPPRRCGRGSSGSRRAARRPASAPAPPPRDRWSRRDRARERRQRRPRARPRASRGPARGARGRQRAHQALLGVHQVLDRDGARSAARRHADAAPARAGPAAISAARLGIMSGPRAPARTPARRDLVGTRARSRSSTRRGASHGAYAPRRPRRRDRQAARPHEPAGRAADRPRRR